ncbi:MAG: ATP synthase subunit I [Candidatus Thiodiazotropha sp. (ex Ctena orbiculata)]|nr:ATP synthase subunit I [Candidatus Thiodiazotropha taylori]
MQLTGNSQIRTIVVLQIGASLILGLGLLFFGENAALSGFIGAFIGATANGYFAFRSFVHYRAQEPEKIAGRLFGAEIQKMVMTGILFGLTIVSFDSVNIGLLLGCYLIVQVAVPLIVLIYQDRQHS